METDMITEEITAKVRAAIAAELRQPIEAVPLAARLDASELGIDSLGLIKLTVRIEELFDVTMPDLAAPGAAQISPPCAPGSTRCRGIAAPSTTRAHVRSSPTT